MPPWVLPLVVALRAGAVAFFGALGAVIVHDQGLVWPGGAAWLIASGAGIVAALNALSEWLWAPPEPPGGTRFPS